MSETIILTPKRKLLNSFTGVDGDPSTQVLNAVNEIFTGVSSDMPETVARFHVTYRLRIPVGTDMYD
jgi:hypothetical protein